MTADDLTRLRAVAEAATPGPWGVEYAGDFGDQSAIIECARWRGMLNTISLGEDHATAVHIATFDPPTVAALIDRVERAERERDRLDGELSLARGTFELMRDELAALRAAVAGLADSLASWAAEWQLTEAVEKSRRDLASDLLTKASEGARALLTERADDGQ